MNANKETQYLNKPEVRKLIDTVKIYTKNIQYIVKEDKLYLRINNKIHSYNTWKNMIRKDFNDFINLIY